MFAGAQTTEVKLLTTNLKSLKFLLIKRKQ